MKQRDKEIILAHGSGGRLTHNLIKDLFACYFDNEYLFPLSDSALIDLKEKTISFTTDSYVVKPLRFPGGDIGKLAICGTINDLVMSGAVPKYISCGFIIEEGLSAECLEEFVSSMAKTAKEAGVLIVAGDTKVVESGAADGLFINTAGIGVRNPDIDLGYHRVKDGDKLIINGTVGDHGMAVLAAREDLGLSTGLKSDCACLNELVSGILELTNPKSEILNSKQFPNLKPPCIKLMRDPTRGGLATTLCEIAEQTGYEIEVDETKVPISDEVKGISEILGIDPLYSANEGKVLVVASAESTDAILDRIKGHPLGKDAEIIGEIREAKSGRVNLKTEIGTRRQISMLSGNQLPRIC